MKLIRSTLFAFVLAGLFSPQASVRAAGISVDAGLNPAEDRWMARTLFAYAARGDDPSPMNREMDMYAMNAVLAYGLRPNLTLLARQTIVHRRMKMGGAVNEETGLNDLFFLAKYGLYRRNTADYTFGVAPTLGLELPTGEDGFGSETWDLRPGLYFSWRSGALASDLNIAYKWNGFAGDGRGGVDPGEEWAVDWAVAYQFGVGSSAEVSVAPVLEFSYEHQLSDERDGQDLPNSGYSVFYLSPGIKWTQSSLILEALVRIPVWQDEVGVQPEREVGVLAGLRYMF